MNTEDGVAKVKAKATAINLIIVSSNVSLTLSEALIAS